MPSAPPAESGQCGYMRFRPSGFLECVLKLNLEPASRPPRTGKAGPPGHARSPPAIFQTRSEPLKPTKAKSRLLKATKGIFWRPDRKSTRLNSSHSQISYAVFCLKKKK